MNSIHSDYYSVFFISWECVTGIMSTQLQVIHLESIGSVLGNKGNLTDKIENVY